MCAGTKQRLEHPQATALEKQMKLSCYGVSLTLIYPSPHLQGKSILLLFNKFDLFCRKLRANTSLTECDWLEDYDPGDHSTASDRFREDVEAQNAYIYIEKKFMALVEERNKRAPQVEVLVYKLSAMQQDSVDTVLQHLPDIVP